MDQCKSMANKASGGGPFGGLPTYGQCSRKATEYYGDVCLQHGQMLERELRRGMPMINTELCVECGTNTRVDGYVNRVPRDTGIIDGYNCGRCEEAYEDAQIWYDKAGKIVGRGEDEDPRFDAEGEELANSDDFERSIDDKMYEKYEKERHTEIDAMFPDAPAFREWCQKDTNENLSDEDQKQVQTLVKNYRHNKKVNQINQRRYQMHFDQNRNPIHQDIRQNPVDSLWYTNVWQGTQNVTNVRRYGYRTRAEAEDGDISDYNAASRNEPYDTEDF